MKYELGDRVEHQHHGVGEVVSLGQGRVGVRITSGRVVDLSVRAITYCPDENEIRRRGRFERAMRYSDDSYFRGEDGT